MYVPDMQAEMQNEDREILLCSCERIAQSRKNGAKGKNTRLVDADHDLACKIDGFGPMAFQSQYVRKA